MVAKAVMDDALTNLVPWQGPIAPRAHLHTDAPSLDLSGTWRFQLVESPCYVPEGFFDPEFDDADFVDLAVPSMWQMTDPAGEAPFGRPAYLNVNYPIPVPAPDEVIVVPDVNPTGCYRRTFDVSERFTSAQRVLLRFEGVDSFARVWLNGVELGWTKGSRLTSEFDVTTQIRPGRNVLAVAVSQWSDGTFLEDQDMWRMSGIFREVTLLARPRDGIDDLFVHASWHDGVAELTIDGPKGAVVAIPELDVTTTCNTEVTIPDAKPWTAETPKLYDATVSTDSETVRLRIGFRTVTIDGDVITVNGRKIVFRGVNRHEWDPHTGRTLDEATMRADLELMKRHGVNAVRTSHYPPNARFLDLCDEYGVWVLLECDLETHGFEWGGWEGNPASDERWYDCLLNRIQRTVERDKNHPSIIGWSMGNESSCGEGIRLMNEWVKQRDPSRFTHYEADHAHDISDVWTKMYPTMEWVEAVRDRTVMPGAEPAPQTGRVLGLPFFMCEFAHAMGNGPGELTDYEERCFDPHFHRDRMHGGFVWEWIDHGIDTGHGYAYGGDFGEVLHDSNFVCDGLVMADRTPSPGLLEFAATIGAVRIEVDGSCLRDGAGITIINRRDFADLSDLEFVWRLSDDGQVIDHGVLGIGPLPAHQARTTGVPIPDEISDRMVIVVEARLIEDTIWAPAGHVVARASGLLVPEPLYRPSLPASSRPRRTDHGWALGPARFDRRGYLVKLGDMGIVPPVLDLFRALIDNDRASNLARTAIGGPALAAGLDRLVHTTISVQDTGDDLVVVTRSAAAAARNSMTTTWTWRATDDGSEGIHLNLHVEPHGHWPTMLGRIGVTMGLPAEWTNVSWFGLGPTENYPDSQRAATWGRWEADVENLQTPYVMPQENGLRQGIHELTITGPNGGIRVSSDGTWPAFAARPWTSKALFHAAHTWDLEPDGHIWLTLDAISAPLGSTSCGPVPMRSHRLYARPTDLSLTFSLV
ncbi:glycoside hydrolase family 2 TIM barrel-domain containing protein [Cutibacterium sp.]|uniref:glycoside hydrolase family 2 TIM barrel-domain containing protein n=1 Tax=Cutibacterium sp. TaxID=1912221 RepID=UPI0026DD375D|nr:glycoside hydrolase family 2 TIM barrel-domain containing protein [Cutibacterium sp.]MDO4413332.1 glycoside hydrolase family 2 TIM barrel-domain containing protein [Cutibacterium sp.]